MLPIFVMYLDNNNILDYKNEINDLESELLLVNDPQLKLRKQRLLERNRLNLVNNISIQRELENKLELFLSQVQNFSSTLKQTVSKSERIQIVKDYFDSGNFDRARAVLNEKVLTEELNLMLLSKNHTPDDLKLIADEFLLLALLTNLNFDLKQNRYKQTKELFKKSINAFQYEFNTFQYAYFSLEHKDFDEAEYYFKHSLGAYRYLEKQDPGLFSDAISNILNNLTIISRQRNELTQAKKYIIEVYRYRTKLAKFKPELYLPDLGTTLQNLGNFMLEISEFKKAENYYLKALEIRRKLETEDSQTYQPQIAKTLYSISNVKLKFHQFSEAKRSIEEALAIFRMFSIDNPREFKKYVAFSLNNLAKIQDANDELTQARNSFSEAIKILRNLVKDDPETYSPELASVLINLGTVEAKSLEYQKAEEIFAEAYSIYSSFKQKDIYLPNLALTLHNLGSAQSSNNKFTLAEKSYSKALFIYRKLTELIHQKYDLSLFSILSNIAFLKFTIAEFEQAEIYYSDAITVLNSYKNDLPYDSIIESISVYYYSASIQISNKDFIKAELSYTSLLKAMKYLLLNNYEMYIQDYAKSLCNFAFIQIHNNKINEALVTYGDALAIYSELSKTKPEDYISSIEKIIDVINHLQTD